MENSEHKDDSYFEVDGNIDKMKELDISEIVNKNQITEAPSEDIFITQKLEIQKMKEKNKLSKFGKNKKIKKKLARTLKKIEQTPSEKSKKSNTIKKKINPNKNNNNVLIPENLIKQNRIFRSPDIKPINKTYNNYLFDMNNNIRKSNNISKQSAVTSTIKSFGKIRNLFENGENN